MLMLFNDHGQTYFGKKASEYLKSDIRKCKHIKNSRGSNRSTLVFPFVSNIKL